MNEDMSEIVNKLSSMINNNSNDKSASGSPSISPETISKMVEMLNSKTTSDNKENTNSSNSSAPNIDIETILKLKAMFEKINSKDDPRSNLLLALKPYLKDSRKQKVEQYIQFFNVSKLLEEFGPIAGGDLHK